MACLDYLSFEFFSKKYFWQYMLSLYLPLQILLSSIFPKETSIWFLILMAGLGSILPHRRHPEQVCFHCFRPALFSFPEKFAQRPTRSCLRDACDPYFWHLQCLSNCCLWLVVFTEFRSGKDGRYDFKIYRKHRSCVCKFIITWDYLSFES